MTDIRRHLEFKAPLSQELTNNILIYFTQPGFLLVEKKENFFRFKSNSSFFSSWKFDPLKWESEINVKVLDDKIQADFFVDTSEMLNNSVEINVWDKFIENFQFFLEKNRVNHESLNDAKEKAKRKGWLTFCWVVLIAIGSAIPVIIIHRFFEFNFPVFWLMPLCVIVFLKLRVKKREYPTS